MIAHEEPFKGLEPTGFFFPLAGSLESRPS